MARDAEDTIQDLEWLDEDAVTATAAAQRTGFPTPHAMERWLDRQGHHDLWLRLKSREPEGTHNERRAAPAVTNIDPIIALLDRADDSPRAAHRHKAAKVRGLIKSLREDLDRHDAEQEKKAEARAEVERLEAQLRDAKARLRTKASTGNKASAVMGEAKLIRAWARDNDVDCPAMGRVPADVREAYEAAQVGGAA